MDRCIARTNRYRALPESAFFMQLTPGYFENRLPLKPALEGGWWGRGGARGAVCSLANYSIAYEETHSNQASDFRVFECSLFPQAILFDFYFMITGCILLKFIQDHYQP